MNKSRVSILAIFLAIFTLSTSNVEAAVDADMEMDYTTTRKLGRGLASLATGLIEVPKTIYYTAEDEGPVAAYSTGLINGLVRFVARELVGVYEITTCWVPSSVLHKQPIITPEYIWEPVYESWNFDIAPDDHHDHIQHATNIGQ